MTDPFQDDVGRPWFVASVEGRLSPTHGWGHGERGTIQKPCDADFKVLISTGWSATEFSPDPVQAGKSTRFGGAVPDRTLSRSGREGGRRRLNRRKGEAVDIEGDDFSSRCGRQGDMGGARRTLIWDGR